jgi:hypothetical protein
MRRKVIQDFANVFCQRFVDLPSGYDLATFAHLGSGTAVLDILTGECTFNGLPIRQLETCGEYRMWLEKQCEKHNIPVTAITKATMTVGVEITDLVVKPSVGFTRRAASFGCACHSQISTAEKTYEGRATGQKRWSF